MKKSAPGWGKAIGIIMICLGGLGIFYQIYKFIIPVFFGSFPRRMSGMSQFNNPFNDMLGMSETQANMLILYGVLGLALSIFYILGGVKLLTVAPANYNFARYALISFIILNAAGCIYFFSSHTGIIIKGIMIYAIVGLVFDITLLIILMSSNKAEYGIGVDESMQVYSVDEQSEEIL
ncbi:MAG: hypothetical protein GQ574_28725 [Crocinitomix sp.]|nr:hypothetical protein [Crocinitomix sp.]